MKKYFIYIVLLGIIFFSCENEKNNTVNNSNNTNNNNDKSEISYVEMFSNEQISQEIEWYPCPLTEGGPENNALCADFSVPLDWNDPENQLISIRVKKTIALREVKRTVVMLQGGPGGSSTIDFPYYMPEMALLDPEAEFIAFDHRGTGYSTFLTCPSAVSTEGPYGRAISEDEITECIQGELIENKEWLEKFNITNASKDLGYFIELIRKDGIRNHVYGVSYGSSWAHRYAQIFPNQASSVTLDSMCLVGACFLDDYDVNSETGFVNLLKECNENQMCSQKMGGDAVSHVRDTLDNLKSGHCNSFDADTIRYLTFSLAIQKSISSLSVALWYRLARCSSEDITAINNLIATVFGQKKNNPLHIDNLPLDVIQLNYILFLNIAVSEMIHSPAYSVDYVSERYEDLLTGVKLDYRLSQRASPWPVYEKDEWYGKFAETNRNFLLLNGTHDLQTPENVSSISVSKLQGENHFSFLIPWANHGVLWSSEVETRGRPGCGLSIFLEYIKDPSRKPSAPCMDELKRPDFNIPENYAAYFFGTSDAWENGGKLVEPELDKETAKTFKYIISKIRAGYFSPI
ncbi:alpha/beta hydrolase [Myxococcota bacterium]|nr:alpha/beta hydrolase [Myxococcota bacterium]MBU1380924.1 alpha/beta hydrolase [Myxococcota bacterium]MBU1495723.1 alpha/beta hydrolase [Myxococcota bacterium]